MNFFKYQLIMCISEQNEWDYVEPNFDEQLKIALKVNKVPQKGKLYRVNNPMELHYNGKCYLSINGFDHNIFDEKGFVSYNE